jgi:ABC-2 type transport system ATP-binding protein
MNRAKTARDARPPSSRSVPEGSPENGWAVVTTGLTKRFSRRVAVDGLDLAIPAGQISGFVGPNGAGKTTTIRMLLGLMRPSSGTGLVLGHPLSDSRAYLPKVGAMIEGPTFYPRLSGAENLAVLAKLGRVGHRRIDEVLARVGLEGRGSDPFRTYSLGMRQRLGIAAALLPNPALLVLDEPTNGLDPHGIAEIRQLLRSLADDGMTVFVSSHLLAEIQQVCEHLVVIEGGRLVFQGEVEQLLCMRSPELVVRTERADDTPRLLALVEGCGRRARIRGEGASSTLEIVGDRAFAGHLNRLAMAEGITLTHLVERRATLEEAFFEITGSYAGEARTSTRPVAGSTDACSAIEAGIPSRVVVTAVEERQG